VSGLLALDGIGLPEVFALHNNYPNPFNPVTNISYDIPEVAQVTLEIYNVTGQKVRTLAQGQHEPGRYRIQWNATNDYGNPLSSGMYIYRIRAGDFVSVKKLILMK
jgi:flagellar hook assembly protein FlgD